MPKLLLPKVFGIGLSRTGTKSLTVALNLLGIRARWYPHDERTFHELLLANYRLSILETYQAITDTPVVPFYPQLDATYPGSKFILTVRDQSSWLSSCARHWVNAAIPHGTDQLPRRFANYIDSAVYGCNAFNRERFTYVYDRHVSGVMEYFGQRSADLLVIDICGGEGYEKLCPFLGLPMPANSQFPKESNFQSPLLS